MRVVSALMLLVGCSFSSHITPAGDDSQATDASLIDVPTVMIDACTSYSTQVNTCIVPTGANMPLDLTGMNTYSTETHLLTRGTQTPVPIPHATVMTMTGTIDVIYASSFSLAQGGTLRMIGPLPVAIVASGVAQINGTIDLVGPAAGSRTDTACDTSVGIDGEASNAGAGGGGGGAFQGDGGTGGDGNSDGTNTKGGAKGTKILRPMGILGGCDGGEGGKAQGNQSAGGDGGGAILIAAGTSVSIGAMGVINAGGGGGAAGNANGRGGGGGGSGGMILIEAQTITVAGVLAANGGGGGEGNTNGRTGEDGQPSAAKADGGGGGDANGGNGGDGGAGSTLDGANAGSIQTGGGGGGGGGVGFIALRFMTLDATGAVISPAHMPFP